MTDHETRLSELQYAQLMFNGFRRSGTFVYRPDCAHCSACTPIRVPVHDFKPSRSQRRCLRRNHDLTVEWTPATLTDEVFELYHRYLEGIHAGSSMCNPSTQDFESFLCEYGEFSRFMLVRDAEQRLLAVACTDVLPIGLSSVYSWYDPDHRKRSLGVFCILQQIKQTQALQRPHLYLGYWIQKLPQMEYKADYRPCEILDPQRGWIKKAPTGINQSGL